MSSEDMRVNAREPKVSTSCLHDGTAQPHCFLFQVLYMVLYGYVFSSTSSINILIMERHPRCARLICSISTRNFEQLRSDFSLFEVKRSLFGEDDTDSEDELPPPPAHTGLF